MGFQPRRGEAESDHRTRNRKAVVRHAVADEETVSWGRDGTAVRDRSDFPGVVVVVGECRPLEGGILEVGYPGDKPSRPGFRSRSFALVAYLPVKQMNS